ncbi:LysM domain [Rhodovulum sp. P5]|uniref:peptidoglycan DD-metalloendopeptidase family protein n=1 Tax=Rhodovulum sp. P5 TaxID=1564506 RepID=UPI0009C247C6|nr:peptidoglycan DD-metalloendopeptidase family protein [Rhodovulum sp. P5]ARE39996.1 LysM domain [Rhodovulum sp. P5]
MAKCALPSRLSVRAVSLTLGLALVAGCSDGWDYDFRNFGGTPNDPLRLETAPRPQPDSRGVISYPNYQVAVAQSGDTVTDVAARVGLPAAELARYNGIPESAVLRSGEIIALPRRVPEAASPARQPVTPDGAIDIQRLAGDAIDRADPATSAKPTQPKGQEPIRHKVERGETAYSIARLYNVTVRALADWNALGPDLTVREGKYLLIPVAVGDQRRAAADTTEAPGAGSAAPVPPSSTKPLPKPEAATKPAAPASPKMATERTSKARFAMPADGNIIRGYQKGKNDGIDISAKAGSAVRAVSDGTVAAITRDTDEVPILVLRHPDNLLSVYANIDGIGVKKGDSVKRGQSLAKVRAGTPAFLHFELRKGFDSIDPMPYLTP